MSWGVTPDQFWDMSFREVLMFGEAMGNKHDRQMHQIAWLAANIVQPWSKKKVTIDGLLGKNKGADLVDLGRKKTTQEMLDEAMRKRDAEREKRYYGD